MSATSESRMHLLQIKGAISELPAEEQAVIQDNARKLREALESAPEDLRPIIFALVTAEECIRMEEA